MSLTDRMNNYVLARSSSVSTLNAAARHTAISNELSTARKCRLPVHHSNELPSSASNSYQSNLSQTRSDESMKGAESRLQNRRLSCAQKEPDTKVQENSPASLSNLLTAQDKVHELIMISNPVLHKIVFPSKQSQTSATKILVPSKLAVKVQRDSQIFADSHISQQTKKQPLKLPGTMRNRHYFVSKGQTESPKVAPHPGDKDIPLITNRMGLLESLIDLPESDIFITKATINLASPQQVSPDQSQILSFTETAVTSGIQLCKRSADLQPPARAVHRHHKGRISLNLSLRPLH